MLTENDFLNAIVTDPSEATTTWLVFADWLEDQDDPRHELVRLLHQNDYSSGWTADERGQRVRALLGSGLRVPIPRMVNSLGMEFVLVEHGTFWMGSPAQERGRFNNEEQKEIKIETDFFLGTHQVTQGQWEAVMGKNPSWFSRIGGGKNQVQDVPDKELKQFPVEQVSWKNVQKFLTKLNEREKTANSGWLYRLPREAEWEYACRGGTVFQEGKQTAPFYFALPTFSLSSTQANFDGNYPYGGAAKGPYLERPCNVGLYEANALGIHDLHGNVWEWCDDLFQSGPYRVYRGGGWRSFGFVCRAAYRNRRAPYDRDFSLGFRLARVKC